MIGPGQEQQRGFPPLRLGRWGDVIAVLAAALLLLLLARAVLALGGSTSSSYGVGTDPPIQRDRAPVPGDGKGSSGSTGGGF